MLPYQYDQLEVAPQHYAPDRPPCVPQIAVVPLLQPYLPYIAATIANSVTQNANLSAWATVFYNEITRDQWNTPGFSEAVGLVGDYTLYYLLLDRSLTVEAAVVKATPEVVNLLAARRVYDFPDLRVMLKKKDIKLVEHRVRGLGDLRAAITSMYNKIPTPPYSVDELRAINMQGVLLPDPNRVHASLAAAGLTPSPQTPPPPPPPPQRPAMQPPSYPQHPQQPYPGYPQQPSAYPAYPQQQQMPFPGRPQQPPQMPAYAGYPQQPEYPGYPPQQPPVYPGYGGQQLPPQGYPQQPPVYPGYPPQQPVYLGYAGQQLPPPGYQQPPVYPGYGGQPFQLPGYPQQPPGYPFARPQMPMPQAVWQLPPTAVTPMAASVAGERFAATNAAPPMPNPVQQGPFFRPDHPRPQPAAVPVSPTPMMPTPPPAPVVLPPPALNTHWTPSVTQPYLVLVNTNTHDDTLVSYNQSALQVVKLKENPMDRKAHQITVFGMPYTPPVAPPSKEADMFDKLFEITEHGQVVPASSMVHVRLDIKPDPVQCFFLERQLFLSEHELDIRADETDCEALTTHVTLNAPIGFRHMPTVLISLQEAGSFEELRKRILGFNLAADKKLEGAAVLDVKKVLLAVDRRLTALINEFLKNELSLVPLATIDSFTLDISSLEMNLRQTYGEWIANAFMAAEKTLLSGIFEAAADNETLLPLLQQQTGLDDNELSTVMFLPENLSITQLVALDAELNIVLGEEPRMIDADMSPWLHQLATQIFAAKDDAGFNTTRTLLITADRVMYTLHRGILAPDVYLINKA